MHTTRIVPTTQGIPWIKQRGSGSRGWPRSPITPAKNTRPATIPSSRVKRKVWRLVKTFVLDPMRSLVKSRLAGLGGSRLGELGSDIGATWNWEFLSFYSCKFISTTKKSVAREKGEQRKRSACENGSPTPRVHSLPLTYDSFSLIKPSFTWNRSTPRTWPGVPPVSTQSYLQRTIQ